MREAAESAQATVKLSTDHRACLVEVWDAIRRAEDATRRLPGGRERACVVTKLQEARLWALEALLVAADAFAQAPPVEVRLHDNAAEVADEVMELLHERELGESGA